MFIYGILLGFAGYVLWSAGKFAANINEGDVAVITSFGETKKDRTGLRILGPGLHWKWPWQKVRSVSLKEQSLDLTGKAGRLTVMAADGTNLHVESSLRYQAMRDQLETFLFGVQQPLEHITSLFSCLLRGVIANIDASHEGGITSDTESSFATVRRERRKLNERIETFCDNEIAGRYGVKFSAVDLTDILPPDDLIDALNAVIQARLESETAVSRQQADCNRRMLGAERGVEVARSRATAAEREIDGIARFLKELASRDTLSSYVARRKTEVLTQSKTFFVRSDS